MSKTTTILAALVIGAGFSQAIPIYQTRWLDDSSTAMTVQFSGVGLITADEGYDIGQSSGGGIIFDLVSPSGLWHLKTTATAVILPDADPNYIIANHRGGLYFLPLNPQADPDFGGPSFQSHIFDEYVSPDQGFIVGEGFEAFGFGEELDVAWSFNSGNFFAMFGAGGIPFWPLEERGWFAQFHAEGPDLLAPPVERVPDAGSTLAMLGMAVTVLGFRKIL